MRRVAGWAGVARSSPRWGLGPGLPPGLASGLGGGASGSVVLPSASSGRASVARGFRQLTLHDFSDVLGASAF